MSTKRDNIFITRKRISVYTAKVAGINPKSSSDALDHWENCIYTTSYPTRGILFHPGENVHHGITSTPKNGRTLFSLATNYLTFRIPHLHIYLSCICANLSCFFSGYSLFLGFPQHISPFLAVGKTFTPKRFF